MPLRRRRDTLTEAQLAVVARRLAEWPRLSDDEHDRLNAITTYLLDRLRWDAARDFDVDEEMRLTIAAHAALPILELGVGAYRNARTVIVHRATIVRDGARPGPAGTIRQGTVRLAGEAVPHGPVLLSWIDVHRDSRHPEHGRNVVLHEFAHQIDALDGSIDGLPPTRDVAWTAAWQTLLARNRDGHSLRTGAGLEPSGEAAGPEPLRNYSRESDAEFFAVATETFFTTPVALQQNAPELYDLLVSFYQQDPAHRARLHP